MLSAAIKCGSLIQVFNALVPTTATVIRLKNNGWLTAIYMTPPELVDKEFSVRNSPKTVRIIEAPNYLSLLPDDVLKLIYDLKKKAEKVDKAILKKAETAKKALAKKEAIKEANAVTRTRYSEVRNQLAAAALARRHAFNCSTPWIPSLSIVANNLYAVVARNALTEAKRLLLKVQNKMHGFKTDAHKGLTMIDICRDATASAVEMRERSKHYISIKAGKAGKATAMAT
jgi:hypothetical protein